MAEYAPILVGEDDPIGDAVQGVIAGPDPLEHQDGDTAYVETYLTGSFESSMVSFRLPSGVTATPTSRVWVSAEAKRLEGGEAVLSIYARPPGEEFSGQIVAIGGGITGAPLATLPLDYLQATVELNFASLPTQFAPHLLMHPDTVFHVATATLSGETGIVRTTWLRFIVEGFIPLRQLHRDDGYGMTPPRAFGGASRNRTRRAFGYD